MNAEKLYSIRDGSGGSRSAGSVAVRQRLPETPFLRGSEVNRVIRALRDPGIEVTALHSHMLDDQPRLFFMHFWANDAAPELARGLRAALDHTTAGP